MKNFLAIVCVMLIKFSIAPSVYAYSMLIQSDTIAYSNQEYSDLTLAEFSIDNDISSRWQGSWWGSNERPQWLIINLGKENYIDEVKLFFSLQNYIGATGEPDIMYDIYTSDEGISWNLINETQISIFHGIEQVSSGAATGLGALYQPDYYFDVVEIGQTFQYIKFDVVGGWEWAHLNEIEIWGEPNPVPEPATIILFSICLLVFAGVNRIKKIENHIQINF